MVSDDKSKGEIKKHSKTKLVGSLKHWCELESDNTTKHEDWNLLFATHGEEDEIYPIIIKEIAEAQKKDGLL